MKSTTRFNKNKKGLECLNCGQPFQGNENFCSNCGQVNDELPLSLKQFISEFFSGFFSFDTQYFRTIVPLLFKPGKVSKEYIEGKRRKYTNPFKMYLHTSIVFFLLIGIIDTVKEYRGIDTSIRTENFVKFEDNETDEAPQNFVLAYKQKLDSVFAYTKYKQVFISDSISQRIKDSIYKELLDMGMKIQLTDENFNQVKGDSLSLEARIKNKVSEEVASAVLKSYFKKHEIDFEYKKREAFYLSDDSDELGWFSLFSKFSKAHKDLETEVALDSLNYEKTRLNLFKYEKVKDLNTLLDDSDHRKKFSQKFLSKIPIALFFLLPIITLFFSLLYIRHPYTYTEHLVVVFNLQTVFFIILILSELIGLLSATFLDNLEVILHTLFIFYFYKTLRNFYQQKRLKTIIKFVLLGSAYTFIGLIGVIAISFLAFLF